LAAWEDLSHPEIAITLGISAQAVRQHFYEAKKHLAAEYNRLENRRTVPAAQKGGAL
jgi:DNA-directed RNA polymerase specialized sigma24 family protein